MITNVAAVAAHLEKAVKDFTDIAVIGISGGVDSSVVAYISAAALGKENVYLISMPYDDIDRLTFNARSTEVATLLGAKHFTLPIHEATDPLEKEIKAALNVKNLQVLTKANIRPRVRMNILYSFSGELGITTKKRVRVLGTGHMSEDLIGYDTKGGDALADIFILSDLVKSEVYQLAKHYGVPKSVLEAEPSAGLYPGQTDKEELGFGYDELEEATLALASLIRRGIRPKNISVDAKEFKGIDSKYVNFVVERYKLHFHKHEAPVIVSIRRPEWFA